MRLAVHGREGPVVYYPLDRDYITIGRDAGNRLVIADASLSRRHCELRRTPSGWEVLDRGSANGTWVDGERLEGPRALAPGDAIVAGDCRLVLEDDGKATHDERTIPTTGRGHASASAPAPAPAPARGADEALVGQSPAVLRLLDTVARIAPSTASVLILGESGTGKELVARLIHRRSPRATAPFVAVNCPALPGSLLEAELFGVERGVATGVEARTGRFEQADGGTLFLDEIGDMDPAAQAKVLRALQERAIERLGGRRPVPVDVRVVAATHHDLAEDIARGTFRRDLYHRLNTVTVRVPPLRDHRTDLPLLIAHFLGRTRPPRRLSEEAMALLERHDFPGNVRELAQALEGASLLARGLLIEAHDLPEEMRGGATGPDAPGEETPAPSAEGAGTSGPPSMDHLYERVVSGAESFWDAVQRPFLRRELSREEVRALIARAHTEAGGSYRRMAQLLRVESSYKKLLNFLRNHQLGVRR